MLNQDEELAPLIFAGSAKGGPEKSAFLHKVMLGGMKSERNDERDGVSADDLPQSTVAARRGSSFGKCSGSQCSSFSGPFVLRSSYVVNTLTRPSESIVCISVSFRSRHKS